MSQVHTGREFEILSQSQFDSLSVLQQLEYVTNFGIVAPTTHNTVPQRFKFDEHKKRIELYLDRHTVLPISDVKGRQAVISMGCVAEQIIQAGAWYKVAIEVDFPSVIPTEFTHTESDSEQRYLHLVTLLLKTDKTVKSSVDIQALQQRRVLRSEYDASVKFDDELEITFESVMREEFPELRLDLLTQQLIMRGMGKFQEQADRFVMENQKFAHELGEWLLPNSDQETMVGMRGYEYGLDDAFSKHIHDGLLGTTRLTPDQISFFARGGKVGIDSSSAIAVISVAQDTFQARFQAGRAYVLLSVLAQQHGFFHAVHAGITEVDWVNRAFATTVLKIRQRPTVVFRLGKPKRNEDLKRPYSARPKLEKLLL